METVSCIICRRRKIKCDRRPVTCANCAKFGAPCSYREAPSASASSTATSASGPGLGLPVLGHGPLSSHIQSQLHNTARGGIVSSNPTTTQAGLQRRRILRSCTACKRAKAKCSGGASCARCTRRAIACVYESNKRDAAAKTSATTTTAAPIPAPAPVQATLPAVMFGAPANNAAMTDGDDPSDTFPSPVSAEHDTNTISNVSVNTNTTLPTSSPHPPATPQSIPDWLVAPDLPPMDKLKGLLDSYFSRIHPLRCMGFLHMPTFFERLRDPQAVYADEYGLMHAICALAAPFHYAEDATNLLGTGTGATTGLPRFYEAGSGWAATAMQRIFHHLGTPDVESLMTEMLIHEYYLRSGEYAKAFMLSGVVARHVQVLQLNLEHDSDLPTRRSMSAQSAASASAGSPTAGISWSTKESRRRLVWCCFLQDAFMECGIDQLRFVNPADIQVQLPCTEELFVRSKPCVTEMLTPGRLLPFVDPTPTPGSAPAPGSTPINTAIATSIGAANLDLRAFYIRAMAIRAKVLKYVKHLRGDVPWSTDPRESRFASLDRELRALAASIPDDLRMTSENTCVFRWSGWSGAGGSSRLGLYFGLHILLAQTFNDLYRVGVANLVFPNHATQWIRANAPFDFLVRCHRMCTTKAIAIATLLEELWQMDRLSLVDTPYAMHAQVCSSVLVMTVSSWQALLSSRRGRQANTDDMGNSADGPVDTVDGGGDGIDPLAVPVFLPQHRRLLQSNVTVLAFIRRYIKADLYYESARQALRRFEQLESAGASAAVSAADDATATPNSGAAAAESPQFSLSYILNPLGVYPMARQQARNRHEPEASLAATAPTAAPKTESDAPVQGVPNVQNIQPMQQPQNMPNMALPDMGLRNSPGVAPPGNLMAHAYSSRTPVYDTQPGLLPTGQPTGGPDLMQIPMPPMPQQAMAGGLDIGESSLFQMWDWETDMPTMDNMGYPTFLDAFPVTS